MPRTRRLFSVTTALTVLAVTALSPSLANASTKGIRARVLSSHAEFGAMITLFRDDSTTQVFAVLEDDVIPGDRMVIYSPTIANQHGPWEVKNPNQLVQSPLLNLGCNDVAAAAWVGVNKNYIQTRWKRPC